MMSLGQVMGITNGKTYGSKFREWNKHGDDDTPLRDRVDDSSIYSLLMHAISQNFDLVAKLEGLELGLANLEGAVSGIPKTISASVDELL